MAESCMLYYITDRTAFPGDERTRSSRLLEKIAEAARAGVDYIQLREKDLPSRELENLAREAMHIIRQLKVENPRLQTALLINSRTDVALAAAADGVHLRSADIFPQEVRKIWQCGAGALAREIPSPGPLIAVSCHSPEEVTQAAANSATFAVFGPVFEKKEMRGAAAAGMQALNQACRAPIPVLALGGITLQNAKSCREAGAAGIAVIRLFQENNVASVVHQLQSIRASSS